MNEEERGIEEEEAGGPRFERLFEQAPWWAISAVFHAIIFAILMTITLGTVNQPVRHDIITVSVPDELPQKVDMSELIEAFEEVTMPDQDVRLESPPLEAPVTDVTPELPPAPELEKVTEEVGAQLEDELLKGLSSDTDYLLTGAALAKIGVGEEKYMVRGVGDYGSVISSLAGRIRAGAGRYGGRVLLIWILDASLSMKDDRDAIRKRLWDVYDALGGKKGGMLMGVVRFGKTARVWLKPTSDIDKVIKAFEQMGVEESGIENVMQALLYCARKFGGYKSRKRIFCVVTDERGNDWGMVDEALKALRSRNITVYVVAREASFSEVRGYEPYIDEDGTRKIGITEKGPETPHPELPNLPWAGYTWRNPIPSGFGFYALSRIAVYTRGAYYMLETEQPGGKSRYDWRKLRQYSPILCSIRDYKNIDRLNVRASKLKRVVDRWKNNQRFRSRVFTPSEISTLTAQCKAQIALCESCIVEIDQYIDPDRKLAKLKNKRWSANIDLTRALFYLARYRLKQYLRALEKFKEMGNFTSQEYRPEVVRGQVLGGEKERQERETVIEAFRDVVLRHGGTPWAVAAENVIKNPGYWLVSYRFVPYIRRHYPGRGRGQRRPGTGPKPI